MRTTINARYYVEAGAFTTKEQSRYTLSAVRIEPHPRGGAIVVATDGHALGMFRDEHGECTEPVTLFWKEWVAKLCGGNGRRLIVEDRTVRIVRAEDDGEPVAELLGLIADAPNIRFPNWKATIPPANEIRSLSFNPEYLRRFGLGSEKPITIWAKDSETQAVITTYGREDFVGILMPVRHDPGYPETDLALFRTEKAEAAK